MTREEAIEMIENDLKYHSKELKPEYKKALRMAIEALSAEPCREADDYENEIADLHNCLDIAEYDKERLREEVTALEEKLKALSEEPCDDTISRADTIEWLKRVTVTDGITFETGFKQILTDIQNMPSATPKPKMGRWIPVSERLPEESLNSVIGWDAYRERCVIVQYIDGHFQITGKPESFDITAWMPLPEPYKAESVD